MKDDKLEEAIGKSWEKVNREIKDGVNPHAYRLGYLDGIKSQLEQKEKEVEEFQKMVGSMIAFPITHAELLQARKEIAELKERLFNMYADQYGSADWIEMTMRETWQRACKAQYMKDNPWEIPDELKKGRQIPIEQKLAEYQP